jgi:predicted DsbA family dithiol-disulfide isomerase
MAHPPLILVADFVCPFSYVTEQGLRRVATSSEVRYLAFELYPAPTPLPPVAVEPAAMEALEPLAVEAGVTLRAPGFVARTSKAHEAVRLARPSGHEAELREAIYRAYWQEGLDIGRIDVLTDLAGRAGLDPVQIKVGLDIDALTGEVERDRAAAEQVGIHQTPTLILGPADRRTLVSGALSVRELEALVRGERPSTGNTTDHHEPL